MCHCLPQIGVVPRQQHMAVNKQHFTAAQHEVDAINRSLNTWQSLDVSGTSFQAGRAVLGAHGPHFLSMLVWDVFACDREPDGC